MSATETETENVQTLSEQLAHFSGTSKYYNYQFGMTLTDGSKFVADKFNAYWLMDVIASYQFNANFVTNPRLQRFQLWMLNVGKSHEFIKPSRNNDAVVTCWEDTPVLGVKPAAKQQIMITDFPHPEIQLYVRDRIILLPNES